MSRFIPTDNGYINADHVVRLDRASKHPGSRYRAIGVDDTELGFVDRCDVEPESCSLPAMPGDRVLVFCDDARVEGQPPPHFFKVVVGWYTEVLRDECGNVNGFMTKPVILDDGFLPETWFVERNGVLYNSEGFDLSLEQAYEQHLEHRAMMARIAEARKAKSS